MFVVAPSPKFQFRLVIVPVEVSVNVTSNGATPLVGVALNSATGTTAPLPVTALVAAPPLAVAKSTLLVNPPAATGANRTVTLVEPPAGTVNAAPATTLYGPPLTVAVPLVTAVPPLLLTTNTRCDVVPVAIVPKSRLAAFTAIWPPVTPVPLTAVVEAPPLLANTTLVLNAPAASGANATVTVPVPPGATVYGLPAVTANGAAPPAVPFHVWPPVLITAQFRLLVCPMVSAPHARLAGATARCRRVAATVRIVCHV